MNLLLLLFDESWWSGINAAYGAMGLLILAAIAILVLLSTKRKETDTINEKRALASDALVRVRDTEVSDLSKNKTKLETELEDITAEYRTLSGIKLDELFKFWETKRDKEAHWLNIEAENDLLKKRLIDLHSQTGTK